MEDPNHTLFFSPISLWEIAIKRGLDRPDFRVDGRVLRRNLWESNFTELAVTSDHALGVHNLPPLHKDPFDRLLVAQARVEGLLLLTADQSIALYGDGVQQV